MEETKNNLKTKLNLLNVYFQSDTFRKKIHLLFYFAIPSLLIISSIYLPKYELFAQFGEWAWKMLLLVLFIKPIVKILGYKELMWLLTYRREMGILCFYFAFFHSVNNIILLQAYNLKNYLPFSNFLFTGLLAIIILIPLYISSNNLSMRYLKKNWKRLQYLSYLVLPLVSIHQIFLNPKSDDVWGIIFLNIAFIILKILEYKKIKLNFNEE